MRKKRFDTRRVALCGLLMADYLGVPYDGAGESMWLTLKKEDV